MYDRSPHIRRANAPAAAAPAAPAMYPLPAKGAPAFFDLTVVVLLDEFELFLARTVDATASVMATDEIFISAIRISLISARLHYI